MRLARRSGKGSYTVTVAPVKREASWVGHEPMALVLVADPDVTPIPPKEMLAQLFGFTAAETRVAERLMMGDSPEQAAAFLHVKAATARWHLPATRSIAIENRKTRPGLGPSELLVVVSNQ